MHKHWTQYIREVFPGADILDAALKYPVTDNGWLVDLPVPSYWRDKGPDHKLFVCLQDWLTQGEQYPQELENCYKILSKHNAPMDQIVFIVEPYGIRRDWPTDRFKIIEFHAFLYETWLQYKDAEDVLREAFGDEHRDFEFNFVCPQRIYKPHRAALHSSLNNSIGNISLQTKGIELKYPNLDIETYDSSYNNLANLLAMRKNYNTALFTIISETQYTERYGTITEKLFNAIVAGHPFLYCAHQHALDQVRNLGFQTYNYIFDETYDELDNVVRMKDMINSNYRFTQEPLSAVEMQQIYEQCSNIIEYNRGYFFDQFGYQMVDELRMDLLNLWGR